MDESIYKLHYCIDISYLYCPISHYIFSQPVIADDGFVYEKQLIKKWQETNNSSPTTRLYISNNFKDCILIKNLVNDIITKYPELKKEQYILTLDEQTLFESENFNNLKFLDDYENISLFGFNKIEKILNRGTDDFLMKLIDKLKLDEIIINNYTVGDYILTYARPHIIKYAIDKGINLDKFYMIPKQYYYEIVDYILERPIDIKILFKTNEQCKFLFEGYYKIKEVIDKLDDVNLEINEIKLIEYACYYSSCDIIINLLTRGFLSSGAEFNHSVSIASIDFRTRPHLS